MEKKANPFAGGQEMDDRGAVENFIRALVGMRDPHPGYTAGVMDGSPGPVGTPGVYTDPAQFSPPFRAPGFPYPAISSHHGFARPPENPSNTPRYTREGAVSYREAEARGEDIKMNDAIRRLADVFRYFNGTDKQQ